MLDLCLASTSLSTASLRAGLLILVLAIIDSLSSRSPLLIVIVDHLIVCCQHLLNFYVGPQTLFGGLSPETLLLFSVDSSLTASLHAGLHSSLLRGYARSLSFSTARGYARFLLLTRSYVRSPIFDDAWLRTLSIVDA